MTLKDYKFLKLKKKWKKLNRPNHQGFYICGICKRWVHESEMTLDHIIARSKRPDLVYDMDNLQPAHGLCNYKKGSKYYGDANPWSATGAEIKGE